MKNKALTSISIKQCIETGIIITLILILAGLKTNNQLFYISSLATGIISILKPTFTKPLAFVWFGLANKMGNVTSWLLLGLIFYLIVTPVGVVRRLSGKDRLYLKKFKKNKESVFIEKYHKYDSSDMIHLF